MPPTPARVIAVYTAASAGERLAPVPSATLEAGRGIVGDRYHGREGTFSEKLRDSADWEVTLIEQEEIDRYNGATGGNLDPGQFRRNIVTAGVALNGLVGQRFRVGSALLEGVRLCEPCAYLATLIGPGVVKAMAHKAGIRARILEGALVTPGDAVGAGDKPAQSRP